MRRATAYLARWWPPKVIDELRAKYPLDEALIDQCKALYAPRAQGAGDVGITADWEAAYRVLLERAKALPGVGAAVDTLINDTAASGIPTYAFKPIADAIAKATGLEALKLKQQMEKARLALGHPPEEIVETPEERAARRAEAWTRCRHLAQDPDLMFRFIEDVQSWGIEREVHAIISTQLVHTSRLLVRPASLLRKGAASSGKNAVFNAALHFSNEGDDWIGLTAGSAKSLVYKDGGVKHKTIYFMEAAGIATRSNGDEDPVAFMTRSLLSENCIKYQTVEEEKDPRTGRTAKVGRDIVLEGPTNAIITTARENVEEEMATRLLTSYADESEERTRTVIQRVFSPPLKPSDDRIEQWRALQIWLRLGPNKVVIPFGGVLADMIATGQLRMRRDAASVRALIEASALLHQAQRDRDGEAIVATLDDYAWAEAATSSGLDAIAAGSEVDTAAVASAIELLLKTERRRRVRHEAARLLAARLCTPAGAGVRLDAHPEGPDPALRQRGGDLRRGQGGRRQRGAGDRGEGPARGAGHGAATGHRPRCASAAASSPRPSG